MKSYMQTEEVYVEESKILDHLGLITATIEKLRLTERIDKRLPLDNPKTTMGQRVTAMIINGLGFMHSRLYMFPKFMHNKPVDRLFSPEITAEFFNDDSLGRCLDEIYEYGTTKIFCEIAFEIGIEHRLLGRNANIDTTSLMVYGDYEEAAAESVDVTEADKDHATEENTHDTKEDLTTTSTNKSEVTLSSNAEDEPKEDNPELPKRPVPKYGFSKEHRSDLKQMVLNIATTGAAGFPVWMEAHSGNASDKTIIHDAAKRMRAFCKALKEAPSFLTIGDSAIYDACVKEAGEMLWLTRMPETHNLAKELVQKADKDFCWTELADDYKICVVEARYKKVHQRLAVVYSQHAFDKEIKTLERTIKKDGEALAKSLRHLCTQVFQCEKDAMRGLQHFKKSLKYHDVIAAEIEKVMQHKGRGRPGHDSTAKVIGYKIKGELSLDKTKVDPIKNAKGRFVLATNQLDRSVLPDEEMLTEYKGQSKTESGFKFIKDNSFQVSAVFLKKPERIGALMMIMTLCLMVYAFAQYDFRCALEKADDTVPSQTNKAIKNPSMKWIYTIMYGIHLVVVCINGIKREFVSNLDAVRKKIICYFGERAMQIYGVT